MLLEVFLLLMWSLTLFLTEVSLTLLVERGEHVAMILIVLVIVNLTCKQIM